MYRITRSMTLNMENIATLLDEKLEEKFSSFKTELISKIKSEIKTEIINEVKQLITEQSKKIDELESTIEILRSQVDVFKNQNTQTKHEELEQYGRRVCLRVNGMEYVPHERSEDVLKKCRESWEKCGIEIPDACIDRAHRIGRPFKDRVTNQEHQGAIIRFTTHRHRSIIYTNRKVIEESCGYRFRLDLTKDRYKLLQEAIELVKGHNEIRYVYSDINCRLKVKFCNNNEEAVFNNIKELNDILNC